ncbi:hypothetical protein [Nocardia tengchongensis]|uniref:hypothetical protein n=1 Tax=Nocardia tengchongensis TaxID=2055889 RepID=UPI0036C581AA
MSVSLQGNDSCSGSSDPKKPDANPLLALALAVSLSTAFGLLVDWTAALTVFAAVLDLFARSRPRDE